MFGERAGKVVFNTGDFLPGELSNSRVIEWKEAMKAAINEDLKDESKDPDFSGARLAFRYDIACDELLCELAFRLKQAKQIIMIYRGENGG